MKIPTWCRPWYCPQQCWVDERVAQFTSSMPFTRCPLTWCPHLQEAPPKAQARRSKGDDDPRIARVARVVRVKSAKGKGWSGQHGLHG